MRWQAPGAVKKKKKKSPIAKNPKDLSMTQSKKSNLRRGCRYFFDGTYGDFSKIPILPPTTPSEIEITKKYQDTFQMCPGDPHPLFFKQKVPIYILKFCLRHPHPDASIKTQR